MFRTWLRMRSRCPHCGLAFERGESGYFIGAYVVNFVIAEAIIVVLMLVLALATWPEVPWDLIQWGIILLLIPAVFATFPFSRSLWVAVDLMIRPADPHDFPPDGAAGTGERG